MVDRDKVILMTKLALIDKNHGRQDGAILSHYKSDYVFINNFKTRVLVFFVALAIWGCNLLWQIEQGLNLPTNQEEIIADFIIPAAIFVGTWLIVYTIISTYIYRLRYNQALARNKDYEDLALELKELHQQKKGDINEERNSTDETIVFKIL
ncbi:MAG: hypothetical protein BEN19_01115 [Epulopiscium sp. Nuni2H_MBin003]|nr:MAG: hypothetical protein BEN19_01115 [Epulopiscium sp. Nuni2H_MBin003]